MAGAIAAEGGAVVAVEQGLTLAHFKAQLEVLRKHIAHVGAQLEHLRATSTNYVRLYGGQSKLELSGNGQSKLKSSGNGNECKPLPGSRPRLEALAPKRAPTWRREDSWRGDAAGARNPEEAPEEREEEREEEEEEAEEEVDEAEVEVDEAANPSRRWDASLDEGTRNERVAACLPATAATAAPARGTPPPPL